MKILIACSEVTPFARTGGLGDFSGSLAVALKKQGHDVRVVTPKHKMTDEAAHNLTQITDSLQVRISNRYEACSVLEGELPGAVPVYFIKKDQYYNRDELYEDSQGDFPDNAERFIYFSRSVAEVCQMLDFAPDILHCNDWQTGVLPVYVKRIYTDIPCFANTAVVFTLHNLNYQGLFWHYDMHLTGLGWDLFTPNGLEYYGKINLMKGGLLWADVLSTNSQTYCREIQTKEYGHGLEGVLQYRSEDLYGIIRGADYAAWNPQTDELIAQNYQVGDLNGKVTCKRELLKEFGLPVKVQFPILTVLSRLIVPKGVDLIAEILEDVVQHDVYLIIAGTGIEKYHKLFSRFAEKYPKKVGIRLEQNDHLQHRILAGADMLLMPSRHEPDGLMQIYALKYGTVPIVRATGGLNDVVKDFQPDTGTGTGFKFTPPHPENFLNTVQQAIETFQHEKKVWKELKLRGMQEDFSWDYSAREYDKLYRKALEKVNE